MTAMETTPAEDMEVRKLFEKMRPAQLASLQLAATAGSLACLRLAVKNRDEGETRDDADTDQPG